jgi:hypothetical protein
VSTLQAGLRVHAERVLIEMTRLAFSQLEDITWDPDPQLTKVHIYSAASHEYLDAVRRITISVGDLSDFKGSIDHLKSWTAALEQRVYVDQSYLLITCYAEEVQEATDMANYLRNAIYAARIDLGKRGIFGLQNVQLTAGSPNQAGTTKDFVYASSLQAAFALVSSETREQGEDLPWLERVRYRAIRDDNGMIIEHSKIGCTTTEEALDRPRFTRMSERDPREDLPGPCAPRLAFTSQDTILVVLSRRVSTYQVSGFSVEYASETVEVPAVRDLTNFRRIQLEPPPRTAPPLRVVYAPGNLEDDRMEPVAGFTVEVER